MSGTGPDYLCSRSRMTRESRSIPVLYFVRSCIGEIDPQGIVPAAVHIEWRAREDCHIVADRMLKDFHG